MPGYLRGQARDQLTAVNVLPTERNVYFAFKTKDFASLPGVATSDLAALGHLTIDALPTNVLIFLRANSPKPPRARKVINRNPSVNEQGSVSTYYGYGREQQVLGAGWDLATPAKSVNLRNKARYVSAVAKVSNGAYYVFPMNTADFTTYGAILGLLSPTQITSDTERAKLVVGASRPRPGKAAKDLGNGAEFTSFYSFDAVDQLYAENFSIISNEAIS